jgi:hypothetical protein
MKNAVFWDVVSCRSCEVNRRFGVTYRLHLQARKIRAQGTRVSSLLQSAHSGSSLPDFPGILNQNITFRELDLLPSSGDGVPTQLGLLQSPSLNQWSSYELKERGVPKKIMYPVQLKVQSLSYIMYVLLVK